MSTPSYFGRAWKLQVEVQATGETWTLGAGQWKPESIRVTFDIISAANVQWWFGDIAIYNPAPGLQDFIRAGDLVTLSAGYQAPGTNNRLIFSGHVSQPLWERENDTDYKLTLHCNVGKFIDETSFVSTTIPAGTTDEQAVRQIAAEAGIEVVYLDPKLSDPATQKPRAVPFCGTARKFFDRVAIDGQLGCWIGWDGLYIRSLAPQGETPDLIYAPPLSPTSQRSTLDGATRYTLIGSPQQTQEGVFFQTLLDSELSLGALVALDFSTLRKLALAPVQYTRPLDKDGVFVVAEIRHTGDTRGNEWYSGIRAVTRGFAKTQAQIRL